MATTFLDCMLAFRTAGVAQNGIYAFTSSSTGSFYTWYLSLGSSVFEFFDSQMNAGAVPPTLLNLINSWGTSGSTGSVIGNSGGPYATSLIASNAFESFQNVVGIASDSMIAASDYVSTVSEFVTQLGTPPYPFSAKSWLFTYSSATTKYNLAAYAAGSSDPTTLFGFMNTLPYAPSEAIQPASVVIANRRSVYGSTQGSLSVTAPMGFDLDGYVVYAGNPSCVAVTSAAVSDATQVPDVETDLQDGQAIFTLLGRVFTQRGQL